MEKWSSSNETKKDDGKNDQKNYRPISLTRFIS
jgi:hypothetical protein